MPESHILWRGYFGGFYTFPGLICANGPSLRLIADPGPAKVIGTNRSFMRVWPDIHVALELDQREMFPGVYEELSRQGRLLVAGAGWEPLKLKVPFVPWDACDGFPTDILAGVCEGRDGLGSVSYVALQVAVWLGLNPIYFVGLDLGPVGGEGHFDGDMEASPSLEKQNGLFLHAAPKLEQRGLKVFVVGEHSRCTAFEKVGRLPWEAS